MKQLIKINTNSIVKNKVDAFLKKKKSLIYGLKVFVKFCELFLL